MQEREPVARLNVYDLLNLLARWRKLFVVNFLLATAIAVVVALTLPVWYRSTTVILPPAGSGGGLPSFLSKDLVGVATSFGLEVPTEDIYQTILGSRTLKERVIEKFNLRQVYELDKDVHPEDLIDAFGAHYKIETREDQAIEVTVEDRDPKLAADMANASVAELDNIYREITSLSASNNRKFIGRRLAQINDTLAALQDSLAEFQRRNKMISLSDQTQAMVSAVANLKAEQMATDIQLGVMRGSLGETHPTVMQLQSASRAMGERYNAIIEGREGDLYFALSALPDMARTLADYYRQVRIQTALIEFVYPQYENARIQEERETSNVQILDKAQIPTKKHRPPRRVIVMIAAAASLVATLVFVILFDYWRGLPVKNQADWAKVEKLGRILRGRE